MTNPPEASVEAVEEIVEAFEATFNGGQICEEDDVNTASCTCKQQSWLREKLLSLVETTRGEGLEKLIEECGERFGRLENSDTGLGWSWLATDKGVNEHGTGSTPTEAVQNLLKAINGERV